LQKGGGIQSGTDGGREDIRVSQSVFVLISEPRRRDLPGGSFCRSAFEKILFFRIPKSPLYSQPSCSTEGRWPTSLTRGRMRWTQVALKTRALSCGRRSRVVLTPRRWCQVRGIRSAGDGGQNARSTGESTIYAVKTIAWGMPGDSGVTCMLVCAFYTILHTRPRGASGARHSLRPQFGEGGK
jgi:hypothetical protein